MKKFLLLFLVGFFLNLLLILKVEAATVIVSAPSSAELKKTVQIQIKVTQSPNELNRVSLFISRANKQLPSVTDKEGICEMANKSDLTVISLKEIFTGFTKTSFTLEYNWNTETELTQVGTHQILAVGLKGSQPCKPSDIITSNKQNIVVKEAVVSGSESTNDKDNQNKTSDDGLANKPEGFEITTWGNLKNLAAEGGDDWVVGLLWRVIHWMLQIAGGLAVIAVIYSGLMYVTASGNQERVEKAKRNLIWAVIAIVIILLVYLIPEWIYNILSTGSSE